MVFFLFGVVVVILAYNSLVAPLYRTEFSIIYEDLIQPIPDIELYSSNQRREILISNLVEEIQSRPFFSEVARALPVDVREKFTLPATITELTEVEKALAFQIKSNTEISYSNTSNVIRFSFYNENPELALEVAQILSEKVAHHAIDQRKKNISNARQMIQEQLLVSKTQLDSAELKLRSFKERNEISVLDEETDQRLKQMTEAEVLLTAARSRQQAASERLNFIQEKINSQQEKLVPQSIETTSPKLEKFKDRLVDLEIQRTDLLMKGYENQHPKLEKLTEEINHTRESLAAETETLIRDGSFLDPLSQMKEYFQESITLQADLKMYDAQVATLQKILNGYNDKIRELPELEMELARLVRTVNTNEKIFTILVEEKERVRIAEAQNSGNIRVIDPPELPTSPIRPNKSMNILVGLLVGLIVGSILVFVFEALDTNLRTSEDVEQFTQLSVLANIPKIKANTNGNLERFPPDKRPTREEVNRLVTFYDSQSYAAEAFRVLRTNLQFASADFRSNAVVVTSPQPGEGKSTTAINLAITTAQLGYNTLLVDADLRRPILHSIFHIKREAGLSDILRSPVFSQIIEDHLASKKSAMWDDFISGDARSNGPQSGKEPYDLIVQDQRMDFSNLSKLYAEVDQRVVTFEGIDNLSILPAGTAVSNASEILGSKMMTHFVSLVKKKYDLVIFDTPPVMVVTDTALLGKLCDGVIMVCLVGQIHLRSLSRSMELLQKGNAKIWGVVMNQSAEERVPRSYRKYYQSHA
ncbi:MAG: polysaccharide biosynthesis tyrosine autokinase [Candidatus Zhuqueibacterota bacterium]